MTGFLNVYKPEGLTSTQAVGRLKRMVNNSCGHMGTLDPLACGVLPVGVGNAARLFNYFLGMEKTYVARFRFGVTTDSLDRECPLKTGGRVPTREEVEAVLHYFLGETDQIPPAYSAKSVNGKRGYDLARKGVKFALKPKKVKVSAFKLLEQTAPDEYIFEVSCGSGTYIRALARDLADALGTQGYMSALERTKSAVFCKEDSVPLEAFTAENIRDFLIPTESVLPYPSLDVDDERYYEGQRLPSELEEGRYKVFRAGKFYGIAKVEGGLLCPVKKLC